MKVIGEYKMKAKSLFAISAVSLIVVALASPLQAQSRPGYLAST
jgi:hypothetical protein